MKAAVRTLLSSRKERRDGVLQLVVAGSRKHDVGR